MQKIIILKNTSDNERLKTYVSVDFPDMKNVVAFFDTGCNLALTIPDWYRVQGQRKQGIKVLSGDGRDVKRFFHLGKLPFVSVGTYRVTNVEYLECISERIDKVPISEHHIATRNASAISYHVFRQLRKMRESQTPLALFPVIGPKIFYPYAFQVNIAEGYIQVFTGEEVSRYFHGESQWLHLCNSQTQRHSFLGMIPVVWGEVEGRRCRIVLDTGLTNSRIYLTPAFLRTLPIKRHNGRVSWKIVCKDSFVASGSGEVDEMKTYIPGDAVLGVDFFKNYSVLVDQVNYRAIIRKSK